MDGQTDGTSGTKAAEIEIPAEVSLEAVTEAENEEFEKSLSASGLKAVPVTKDLARKMFSLIFSMSDEFALEEKDLLGLVRPDGVAVGARFKYQGKNYGAMVAILSDMESMEKTGQVEIGVFQLVEKDWSIFDLYLSICSGSRLPEFINESLTKATFSEEALFTFTDEAKKQSAQEIFQAMQALLLAKEKASQTETPAEAEKPAE
ncbi:MAG: hypothetical protein WCT16_03295 [Candidatus Buchananbacteria bacterium]